MEIKTNTSVKVENNTKVQTTQTKVEQENSNSSVSFAEEIKGLKEKENENNVQSNSEIDDKSNVKNNINQNIEVEKDKKEDNENILGTPNNLDINYNFNITNKKNNVDKELDDLKLIVEELNISKNKDDEHHGADDMFNNINSNEPTELLNAQMNMGMNMNMDSNGQRQSFGEFLNKNEEKKLVYNEKDLLEEVKILSTMEENLAMINQNIIQQANTIDNKNDSIEEKTQVVKTPNVETVIDTEGIKKVDKNTNITQEVIVKYNDVVMTKNDVEFFNNLVNNNISQIDSEEALKSLQTSKNLSDLLLKAMNDNQPVRINFDNNISIIIKISREGKLSVDFLPSSQVAEAYLKENLPLLKQRFDENNIDYDELNQRQQRDQRQDERNNKQKKGRKDE